MTEQMRKKQRGSEIWVVHLFEREGSLEVTMSEAICYFQTTTVGLINLYP